jgi:hypothetical protein
MLRKRKGPKAKTGSMPQKDSPLKVKEPKATRPTVPGYEFSKKASLLPWKWAAKRLKNSRQYWIATTRPDGAPHLMIIWGLWFMESFWFSTGATSREGRNLEANPKCVIGTDDPAKAVILEGAVELIDTRTAEFVRFSAAYEKKYEWNGSRGFGLHEKKFGQTATRWEFG